MNFYQSIFRNNNLRIIKYLSLIALIFILSFKANTEIPEKYKIESSLPNCKGTDYKIWTDCYGEYQFPRIEYKGEWKDGNFHGKGILREAWGDIYFGDFKNNKAEGYGRQDFIRDGKIVGYFEGQVKNDLLNGKGVWVGEDGSLYKGEFKDHKLDGFATAEYHYGSKYEGYWKNDLPHGEGTFIYSDGSKYIGKYKQDQRHGEGIMEWANADKFIGEYFEDYMKRGEFIYANGDKFIGEWDEHEQRTSKGKFIWSDGAIYEGDWENGYRTGKGKHTYANGDKYIGEFIDGQLSGKGEFLYINGNSYSGEFSQGEFHGKGIFNWVDGEKYKGDWENGYRTGKGKYTYASGTIYEGDFFENAAEGKGILIYADGDKYEGEFKAGNEHGEGTMEYANGDKYTGQFDEGYRHGNGKMVYANGDIYEGLWQDGREAEGKTTLAKFTTDEKYYALIIGNNDYEKLENLDNAINDAKDLEKVLKEKYGFKTTLMIDKKSNDTLDAIIDFTQNREKNDNILIYYAGHGQLVKKQKRGYWLPTDSGPKQDSKWISNNNIKDLIGSSDAKHILLIVDSCFSGSLMRGSGENKSVEKLTQNTVERLQSKLTRLVITSGGNEQVADGIGASKNSVFAQPLIKTLKNNNDVIRSIELFQKVQNYVINNADQTPNHSLIHGTGHDGGEFLFFPKS